MPEHVVRWGLLGTARINRMVIPPLRASAGNRLVAVASRDPARAAAYAQEWGIGRAHGSYEALLADPEIDAVYIPLPNHLHAEWTLRATRAGKHVLCEKPLALSVAEVDAMGAAAREGGVALAEAFMYRHHPQTLKVRELVDGGAVGAVRFLRGTFHFPLTRPDDVRLRPEWGGGCLWDVGCYPLSFARFVIGTEPLEVFGSQVSGPTGIDETFAGQLVFPGGVLAQIDAGFRAPLRTGMEVVGTDGAIAVRQPWKPDGQPILLTRGNETEEIAVGGEDRYLLEIEDLADCARTGRAPRVTLAESRGNVAAIVALRQSAREGRPVRL
ncbi:MAG TPA: Gfo/Idh/MocA family oxidoreductase [Vicinamibacteria bacterium]|nr:Gfo/Idh/MocA family oxidoreductase [Vicinamibacteria bacterium]